MPILARSHLFTHLKVAIRFPRMLHPLLIAQAQTALARSTFYTGEPKR